MPSRGPDLVNKLISISTWAGKEKISHKRTHTCFKNYEGGGDEREHIHIYQVIHHQSARDTLSRC
jgi:hypothetical protein